MLTDFLDKCSLERIRDLLVRSYYRAVVRQEDWYAHVVKYGVKGRIATQQLAQPGSVRPILLDLVDDCRKLGTQVATLGVLGQLLYYIINGSLDIVVELYFTQPKFK